MKSQAQSRCYKFLVRSRDLRRGTGEWTVLNNNFATTSASDGRLVGQFISSIWYKVKIPTEGDYECAVIRTTRGEQGRTELAKTLELMGGCEAGEISYLPTVDIYHRLTAEYLKGIRAKLRRRLLAEETISYESGITSIHDYYEVRRGTFGMSFEAVRTIDPNKKTETTLFCMCNPSFTIGG